MNECPRAEGKEFFRLLNKFDGHQFIGLQEEAEIRDSHFGADGQETIWDRPTDYTDDW